MKLYRFSTRAGNFPHNPATWQVSKNNVIQHAQDLFHCYRSIELAILCDPGDAGYLPEARLWECEGEIAVDSPLKCGCRELKVITELPLPDWYTNKNVYLRVLVRFAILCLKALSKIGNRDMENACENVVSALRASDECKLEKAKDMASAAWELAWLAEKASKTAAYAAEAALQSAPLSLASRLASDTAFWTVLAVEEANNIIDFDKLAKQAVEMETRRAKRYLIV